MFSRNCIIIATKRIFLSFFFFSDGHWFYKLHKYESQQETASVSALLHKGSHGSGDISKFGV